MLPAVPRPSHLNMKPEPQTFSKPHLPSPASTQNQQTGSTQRESHRGNWKHPLSNEHQKLIPVSVISNHFEKSGQSQVQRGWFIFLFFLWTQCLSWNYEQQHQLQKPSVVSLSFGPYSGSFSGTSSGSSTILCGRLMCLLRAAESSPATLVASQLLPPGQLTLNSIQRHNHKKKNKLWNLVVKSW